jgi:hypothetical protein
VPPVGPSVAPRPAPWCATSREAPAAAESAPRLAPWCAARTEAAAAAESTRDRRESKGEDLESATAVSTSAGSTSGGGNPRALARGAGRQAAAEA